jgi:hypothetical protein
MADSDPLKPHFEARVSGWLEQQAYPLEMEVAGVFDRHKFRVTQADYYTDPKTGGSGWDVND